MGRWISRNARIARHPLVRERAAEAAVELARGEARPGDEFVGWGYKGSGRWAMREAEKRGVGFRLFEDGFVRSLRPGYGEGALYSLVEDGSGIYYDGSGKSDLVRGLNGEGAIGAALEEGGWEAEAGEDLRRYREIGASKYNWFPGEFEEGAAERSMPERGVLVVDQTSGDAAIGYGGVGEGAFEAMLSAALEENPGQRIYVRGHPDHLFRAKRSCIRSGLLEDARVSLLDAGLAPWQVFERVERVYVATSLMGLEALLHEKEVVVFGCPFYAGWGLSDDRNAELPKRARARSVAEIFEAAYRRYSRYYDPDTGESCSPGRVLDHLALQKERFRENAGSWVAFRMAPWRKAHLGNFLASPGGRLCYTASRGGLERMVKEDPATRVLVWGARGDAGVAEPVRVEDGFLRSAGLGAEFNTPLSLIFDAGGIYYDCAASSGLEALLGSRAFNEKEIAAARRLVDFITGKALTKYNLGEGSGLAEWPAKGAGARRILVPGQVESDASVLHGSPRWKTNLELLREVRTRCPDAVIAYKRHPDVVKGLRPGDAETGEIRGICDAIVEGLDIVPWLESCDEVHTMTSLSGFEGLLRGKSVTCYGAPFYSGWGLTEDLIPVARRGRKLRLEELAGGALMRYPRYVNPVTGEFTTALGAAELLARPKGEIRQRPAYLRAIAGVKKFLRRG